MFGIKTRFKRLVEKQNKVIAVTHPILETRLLDKKNALIVGGTGGIGHAIAKALIESGCNVIVAGTNRDKLNSIENELSSSGKIKTIRFNIADVANVEQFIEGASALFGTIDILINAAGVHTEDVDFWTMTPDEYNRVMNINLTGVFFLCQTAAKYMCSKGIPGRILLVSSSRGSEPAWTPYGISKWGLNGFTKGLADILITKGITVNAIAPGSTATALIGANEHGNLKTSDNGKGRLATPDEIAFWAKMLVCDASDMITGEVLHVSAGRGTSDIRC